MKKLITKILNLTAAFSFVAVSGGALLSFVPQVANATDCSGNNVFITFPAWYRGLASPNANGSCDINSPGSSKDNATLSDFIWHIVLNCIDIALQLVGFISGFLIIYGGFLFLTSSGEASNVAKAKTTITNAVIGLVISILAVTVVNLIFSIIPT